MFRNVLFVYTFGCLIFTKTGLLFVSSDSASCTISSYFETPSGDYSMPSECVAGATIPHGFECTLTCPTGSHVVGTQPTCTNGALLGTVGCMDDSDDAAGATTCSTDSPVSTYSPCPYDSFCNFDYGISGFCESCSPHRNSNQTLVDLACGSDGLPDAGVSDCKNKCHSTMASCTIPRDFETPSGDFSMPSECVAGATIPHGFECTLTCPTSSHVMGTQPSCMNGAFFGTVGCMDNVSGKEMCSTFLTWSRPDSFCNFDNGNWGFLESCSPYRNSNQALVDLACGSDGLPDSGVSDCKNKCLSSPASILTGRLGLISASVVAFVLV
jgi:hypothetical protein